MTPYARATVREMQGYVPGEQPAPGSAFIKLNTNENPYPPSPKVMEAIRNVSADSIRRYPPPNSDDFRRAAAEALGVTPDMILAGNGSDEVLAMAVRTQLDAGDVLAFPDPTYSLYPVLARIHAVRAVALPWKAGWRLPHAELLGAAAKAIFIANPNAPSGTLVPPVEIERLAAAFRGIVLVDEAYADFASESCLELVSRRPNVIVSRTLSKSHSLAGMRFGFAVAQPDVIREMAKVKDSYNCDIVSIAAATAAIRDQAYAKESWRRIRSERDRLTRELEGKGWLVVPSQANFLLATPPRRNGLEVTEALKERGVLVRHFDLPMVRESVRITVGSPEEDTKLLEALATIE